MPADPRPRRIDHPEVRLDVLARLLAPSPLLLSRCGYVAVEFIPPGGFIRSRDKDSCAVIPVGEAAREVLFEAAHVIAWEMGVELPDWDMPLLSRAPSP